MFVGTESEKTDPSGHTQSYSPGLFSHTAGSAPQIEGVSMHSSMSLKRVYPFLSVITRVRVPVNPIDGS